MKVAGKMQKEVTSKRSQLDQLKSKIYWLEECLESVSKVREGLAQSTRPLYRYPCLYSSLSPWTGH